MKRLGAIGAIGLMASCLYAQGLDPGTQTRDQWEEINFEFNSSILSDGYPSLLRLADLLREHRDYRVRVTGYTDYVGSAQYNDKLAQARADTVKSFLVKYGASADQITTSGDGKRNPTADNKSKEGRFMNRRVVVAVADASGKTLGEGGMNEVLAGPLQELIKKQEECCSQILKRLDRLDEILAAMKDLRGENDKLQSQLTDLRNQHNQLRDQVSNLPRPLTEQQTQSIAHSEAIGAVDEAQNRNRKFSLLGLNVGPTFGPGRTGDYSVSASARYFSPFGGDGARAVQAQGEYMYYSGRQEGQFDIGLVNRWKAIQAGAFASFKYLQFKEFQSGGALGQAAFMVDWVNSRGRVGVFGTQGFKNYAILNNVTLAPGAFLQTYARVVNQYGVSALVGLYGDAYLQGNLAYLKRREGSGSDRPGAMLKFSHPLNDRFSLTAEAGYNETFLNTKDSGRIVFGFEFGNQIKPKEYASVTSPVPMDVPRVRYELGTRRVGSSPPVADAGADQPNPGAGTITLNGSGSYDPLGLALTYSWTQISGPTVTLASPNSPITTFNAATGQVYMFRLTVRNSEGLQGTDSVSVGSSQVRIVQFSATPATVESGAGATLSWVIENAASATITPAPGNVDPRTGSVTVTPTEPTTYTLTATSATGTTTTSSVTVGIGGAGPQVLRFEANPLTIQAGGQTTLSWTTTGASTVSISGLGNVNPNGSVSVSPAQTTTYVLTATSSDGRSVTAPITITVGSATAPQISTFTVTPQTIEAGQQAQLCWNVTGSTSVNISPGVGTNLGPSGCATVTPTESTTYTLTAGNNAGSIQANVTVNVGGVKILSFTSNPSYSTLRGSPVTLSWQTTGATSVVLTANDLAPQSNLPVNGSLVVTPVNHQIYTLTAYGPGGQTVSVPLYVYVR